MLSVFSLPNLFVASHKLPVVFSLRPYLKPYGYESNCRLDPKNAEFGDEIDESLTGPGSDILTRRHVFDPKNGSTGPDLRPGLQNEVPVCSELIRSIPGQRLEVRWVIAVLNTEVIAIFLGNMMMDGIG